MNPKHWTALMFGLRMIFMNIFEIFVCQTQNIFIYIFSDSKFFFIFFLYQNLIIIKSISKERLLVMTSILLYGKSLSKSISILLEMKIIVFGSVSNGSVQVRHEKFLGYFVNMQGLNRNIIEKVFHFLDCVYWNVVSHSLCECLPKIESTRVNPNVFSIRLSPISIL